MVARFGVRRGWLSASTRALVSAAPLGLLLAVAGCAGEDLVVAGERPSADPAEEDGPGSTSGATPPRDVTLVEDCPPSPEARQAAPGCWPPRHLGVWRGFFVGVPRYATIDGSIAEFPTGDVLLRLGIDGSGSLIFGAPDAGDPPSDTPLAPCAPGDAGSDCGVSGLVLPGFPYHLVELELFDPELETQTRIEGEPRRERAERVQFVVHVGEPWDGWCAPGEPEIDERCTGGDCAHGDGLPTTPAAFDSAAAASVERSGCRCDATGCRAAAPSLSISLQMSDDRKALRGAYLPNAAGIEPASLQFAWESAP